MNRAEYANVIRDLVALDVDVAQWLPPGDAAFGFATAAPSRRRTTRAPSQEAVETIRLLASLSLAVDAVDDAGNTALHAAVTGRGSPAIIAALVELGADPVAANAKGETPLALAQARASPEIVEQLRAAARERGTR